jgi:hypothetical protein
MDTTIIRRAVKHVDTATARNIVAYVATLSAPHIDESTRLFQPRGAVLNSDVDFAVALFGRDAWPSDLTTAGLQAIDPRTVQIAVKLPIWSDEKTNLDWMPDNELPAGILDYNGGLAAASIAGYRAAPTKENLLRAVNAIRNADHATANASAPCLLEDAARVKYRDCFEVRRWAASLVALHFIRNGMNQDLGGETEDIWWDVGNAARRSKADASVPIANPNENWAAWMFLGWAFNPSSHSSSYTGEGFSKLGLSRHATFIALRTEVVRPKNSASVYEGLCERGSFRAFGVDAAGRIVCAATYQRASRRGRPAESRVNRHGDYTDLFRINRGEQKASARRSRKARADCIAGCCRTRTMKNQNPARSSALGP